MAAPTISDGDDQEDDLARIVLYFLLSSRVSLQDLECKLYDISMNISPVSQKKKTVSPVPLKEKKTVTPVSSFFSVRKNITRKWAGATATGHR